MVTRRSAFIASAGGFSLACCIAARAQQPGVIPSPTVRNIVEEAIGRGSRVILKRVDYVDGQGEALPGAQATPGGAVRSKTYIEIDTRPSSVADEEVVQSQKRVEESQQQMIKAVGAIGQAQESQSGKMSAIEGRQQDAAAAMKSSAGELGAVREASASAGSTMSDADRTVQDSNRLLKQISAEIKSLSSAVDELSARVDQVGQDAAGAGAQGGGE
jgi:hypothetical protein